ncbi:MAG: hypothetical protein ABIA63_08725 [bacterium]
MKRFALAFISPGSNLVHRIVEAENQEEALNIFFNTVNFISYTRDKEGFEFFKEDFLDTDLSSGSIIEL